MASVEPATIVSASKIAIVEFHGFKDNNNRFVIKEFAIVSRYFHVHLIFEAPYDESCLNSKMQRTARWLTRHFHFMKWNARGIPYDEELIRTLLKPFTTLYTNGSEKASFLKEFHDNVEDIKGSGERSLGLSVTCILPQHNRGGKCALRSAKALYKSRFDGGD
jgi:hypothetical protein